MLVAKVRQCGMLHCGGPLHDKCSLQLWQSRCSELCRVTSRGHWQTGVPVGCKSVGQVALAVLLVPLLPPASEYNVLAGDVAIMHAGVNRRVVQGTMSAIECLYDITGHPIIVRQHA